MGKMIDIVTELQFDNPKHRNIDLQIFADALINYREASRNVRVNGAVVMHPRTGAPIDNPYLRIQGSSGAILGKINNIKSDRIVLLLDKQDAKELIKNSAELPVTEQ